jgi:hypothetical protein
MKKIFILFIAVLLCFNGFAQRIHSVTAHDMQVFDPHTFAGTNLYGKTTATGDTAILKHITSTDTITVYKVGNDSGYAAGTNYWGDKAFAERYDFTDDSGKNMQVIGLLALFNGKVNPATNKTVTFTLWDEGPQQSITGTMNYRGFPGNVLNTLTLPITQIGIGATDTMKGYLFATPTPGYYSSFFLGYSIDYDFLALNGDTIGLASSKNGERSLAFSYTTSYLHLPDSSAVIDSAFDTIMTVQNAVFGADNHWYDNYTQNDSLLNNLAIYPVVITGYPASVKGVVRNGLTFYGNYPNPAITTTNIQFSLANTADVTVRIMDMSGRVMNTISKSKLSAGAHTVPIDLSGMPAGDYLYLVTTSAGDGIAGKVTHP